MPSFLVPRNVSAHRISAIALYRALLHQSRAVPLPAQSQKELQNVVRNRCKQSIHLHSYQRLKLAFQAGYEALDHLDAAVAGDEKSTSYIAELLAKAPAKVKADPPASLLPKSKKKEKKETDISTATTSSSPAAKPSTTELFSRPHPLSQLSGKRHVPVLFSANSIPILRIKKPQPESLSGFIRHRIEQRQRRHDRKHWLTEQIQFAQYEDLWDEIVEREVGVREDGGGREEPTWAEEFEVAKNEVDWLIRLEGKKNVAMAAKMQGIVDRETEIFERERAERKEAKRVERAIRRSAGDEKTSEEAG
ncbi:hypothetical protein MBLNU13_g09369t1 [Cladosporium sp. NU13]